jgi:hypothetical protein
MTRLNELHKNKVNLYLLHVAELIDVTGLSRIAPKDQKNRLSLPFAIAILCGADQNGDCDDFEHLLDRIPRMYTHMFILCWEAIELEVEMDIVSWSETVGKIETVRRIRNLAKSIEHS